MQDWWKITFPKGCQNLTIEDANGETVQIAYGEKGKGQPLVLVHGLGDWSVGWRYNVEALSQHFRVICVDAKGYGFSDKPTALEKSGYQVIELQRIVQGLCEKPAILVTKSLWSVVALALVRQHPQLIAGLVLIDPSIFPEQIPNEGLRRIAATPMGLIRGIARLNVPKRFPALMRPIWRSWREDAIANSPEILPDDVFWQFYPFREFPNAIVRLAIDTKLATEEIQKLKKNEPCMLKDVQDNLSVITCPTLILWGEKDRWFPCSDAEKLQSCLPNATVNILQNCGHDGSVDCPNQVNSSILEFLRDRGFGKS